jgi:hypothetical protein
MAADRQTLGFKANSDLAERVNQFKNREDYEHNSDALEELVRVGLRETQNPVMYRLKDEILNWAGLLGVTAIITIIGGLTTPVIAPGHALLVATILCVTAMSMVAIVELARAWQGQSTVGRAIREVIA